LDASLPLQQTLAILKRDLANLVPPGGTLCGELQTTPSSSNRVGSQAHQRTLRWVTESDSGRPWIVANDEQNPADMGVPPDPGYAGHSGEAIQDGKTYTLKSRTVGVLGIGDTIEEARNISLEGINAISGGALWNRTDKIEYKPTQAFVTFIGR
jgi:hypothetical protein